MEILMVSELQSEIIVVPTFEESGKYIFLGIIFKTFEL